MPFCLISDRTDIFNELSEFPVECWTVGHEPSCFIDSVSEGITASALHTGDLFAARFNHHYNNSVVNDVTPLLALHANRLINYSCRVLHHTQLSARNFEVQNLRNKFPMNEKNGTVQHEQDWHECENRCTAIICQAMEQLLQTQILSAASTPLLH